MRSIRKEKGLTQEALAEKAGLHYSYIGGVERGERNISLETLEKIIEALEVLPIEVFQFQHTGVDNEIMDKRTVIQSHNALLINASLSEVKLVHRIAKDILNTYNSRQ
jgi:transcriptional regulator with XRE-family HTH domain